MILSSKPVRHNDVISGIWKFRKTVPIQDLLNLASTWAQGEDGNNYLKLNVRWCEDDKVGVDFMYRFGAGGVESYFDKTRAELSNRFGLDFVGCDTSTPVWVIK